MKQHQSGFSRIAVIMLVVVVIATGFAGRKVYQDNQTNKNNRQNVVDVSKKVPSASDNGSQNLSQEPVVITKNDLKEISINAPKCGSNDIRSQIHPKELELTYTKPEGWSTLFTYPNGIAYKSPDFKSVQGFKNISKGASLALSTSTACTSGNGLAADMESWVKIKQNNMVNPDTQLTFFKVAGYYGVRLNYNLGENLNNHDVALLIKADSDRMHTIEEEYSYSSANPYPDIIDQVLKSIK